MKLCIVLALVALTAQSVSSQIVQCVIPYNGNDKTCYMYGWGASYSYDMKKKQCIEDKVFRKCSQRMTKDECSTRCEEKAKRLPAWGTRKEP